MKGKMGAVAGRRWSRREFLQGLAGITGAVLGGLSFETAAAFNSAPGTCEVAIIGGGIAGLTAAYLLRQRDVQILEQNAQIGGRTLSGEYQGWVYAKGTEYLGLPEGTLKQLIQELKLKMREIPAPMDATYSDGKFYYGDEGLALLSIKKSSLGDYNRFMAQMQQVMEDYADVPDFDLKSDLARLDRLTVRQWFDELEAPRFFYERYNVAARGLFGANLDEISALSFIPEIAFDYMDDEPIQRVADLENLPTRGRESTGAYTLTTGITEITAALAGRLANRIQRSATVTAVTRKGDRYQIAYTDKTGKARLLLSNQVVLAVPAPIVLKIAPTLLSAEPLKLLKQIPYAPYLTVALFSEEPIFNQAFDLAVPDGGFFTDIYDSTWVQRLSDPARAKKPGYVMGIYVAPQQYKDSKLVTMTDAAILQTIYAQLEGIFPKAAARITGHDIQRFQHAYPVMTPGAYQRLTRLHATIKGDVALAGDYMIYPTFEAAVESGALAAEQLM